MVFHRHLEQNPVGGDARRSGRASGRPRPPQATRHHSPSAQLRSSRTQWSSRAGGGRVTLSWRCSPALSRSCRRLRWDDQQRHPVVGAATQRDRRRIQCAEPADTHPPITHLQPTWLVRAPRVDVE